MHTPTKARLTRTVGAKSFRAQGRVITGRLSGYSDGGYGRHRDPLRLRNRRAAMARCSGESSERLARWYYNGACCKLEVQERAKKDPRLVWRGSGRIGRLGARVSSDLVFQNGRGQLAA